MNTQLYKAARRRGTYIALALFFGALGLHNFYAGYINRAGFQVLLTISLIGIPISILWAWCDMAFIWKDADGDPLI